MNSIDKMLFKNSKKIQVELFPNSRVFDVAFGAFPEDAAIAPLFSLIETGRFEWRSLTSIQLENSKPKEILNFGIESINVIPVSEAIAALTEMWEAMGYEVSVTHPYEETLKSKQTKVIGGSDD